MKNNKERKNVAKQKRKLNLNMKNNKEGKKY